MMSSPKQPAKLAVLLLLALLLLCNGVGNVHGKTIHENSVDLHALLDFKKGITNDPRGALSNWSNTTHFCRWNGVICTTTRPFRVSSLNLTGQNLGGQISSSLGNLTFLCSLDLSVNNFVGPLPSLGHLQKLETLYLNENQLNGIIPDSLTNCSNLTNLDLSANSLVGEIPQELHVLSNLVYLDLSKNSLVGAIPPKVGLLTNLSTLDLSMNSLVGVIPPKLGFLPSLEYINLRSNKLEGRIPDELWKSPKLNNLLLDDNRLSGELPHAILNLPALQYLGLGSNNLGKALPPNIGNLLPNLVGLGLHNNTFEGQIPASLGNPLGLKVIDLSNNKFTGRIPPSIGKLSNLTWLNLEYNQLETRDDKDWEFFSALTNCHSLSFISLSYNKLQGSIPQSVGNLSTGLEQFLFAENSLSGQVPRSIGKLSALTKLGLDGNNISGEIGGWIGNLNMLRYLNLQSNSFTGPIPASIENFARLTYLYLRENEFEGIIPARLVNLPLEHLELSNNNLQGYIPSNFGNLQGLLILNLSHNYLQGDLLQISNLEKLVTLDLSSNKLTGKIPDSLGQCYDLVTIQMDQNFLSGNIPVTFGNLSLLGMLNLSHNNLSGTIPLALNRLESLSNLDLSYNHFQGEIPRNGVLENATAVSLEGNWGLCGGAMDLHMPPCPAVSRISDTEYYLIRALIPLFGFLSLILLTYVIITGKKAPRRTNLFLISFGKKFPRVSYKDLNQATGNFSQAKLLGRGSYGSVYRGNLTQAKIQVAIKVFDLDMKFADKSFVTECDVLRSIRHRNLLPILTACSTIDYNGDAFKALIYEFMPNGNLDTWLHGKFAGGSSRCLSLAQRTSIAVGIADALAYLHHDCERQIVHCDLKPTNILLDDDMNAYLGDFGIASLVGHSSSNTSVGLNGTIGYIAPEYAQSGQASIHGDVYSFGIVLLEMLIGKRPTDPMFENELNLVNFAERNYADQTLHIIDARVLGECEGYIQANIAMENVVYGCLLSLMQVALSCTCLIPRERMDIREVTNKLHSINTSYIRVIKREQVLLH